MPTTEYKNDIFQLKLTTEVPVHLLPASDTRSAELIDLLHRLHLEADVLAFKATDIGGGSFTVEVEHSNGSYSDLGTIVDGVVSLVWPDAIGDAYAVPYVAALMSIRVELARSLEHYHPTLVEVEFF